MRGLDPSIYALAIAASARCKEVDGRIKSGHDDCESHGGLCAFAPMPAGNVPGQPCAMRETSFESTAL